MNSILGKIAQGLLDKFGPEILKLLEDKFAEWEPKLLALLKEELDKWLPVIMKTVAVSMAQSAGQLVVDTEHKITDIIPGKLDDNIVNGITQSIFAELNKLGIPI